MGNLVLTRRAGQTVHIGGDITVTVIGIDGGQVRLAFSAPPNVRIDRSEVRERINAELVINADRSVSQR
jgi:carbon storage regulator